MRVVAVVAAVVGLFVVTIGVVGQSPPQSASCSSQSSKNDIGCGENVEGFPMQDGYKSVLNSNVFLEKEAKLAALRASQPPWYEAIEGKAEMGLYFSSPIYRTNINKFLKKDVVDHINRVLSARILDSWNNFADAVSSGPLDIDEGSYNEINNKFFKVQHGMLEGMKEMKVLKNFWDLNVLKYYSNIPTIDFQNLPLGLKKKGNDFQYWATVNKWGIDHQAHTHLKSIVSGCYYLKTPPLSGDIRFTDPRGYPQYPFMHRLNFSPIEGDLVLFPGWMPHTVLPTPGAEARVAIAFNINGEEAEAWLDTTNVLTKFYVD
eukprot:m.58764 g.58764  ORF g.58764 m.58764 type:complete len:318 (-) comp7880_c1_seq2:59-1012(-)